MFKLLSKVKRKVLRIGSEGYRNATYALFGYLPKIISRERGLRILIYHGICSNEASKFNSRFLTLSQFEEHLIALKKCFNPISADDFIQKNFSENKLNVLLTFDDGLKNNFELALPLLLKYKIPSIFFITTVEEESDYLFSDLLDVFSLLGPEVVTIKGVEFKKILSYIHYRYADANGILLARFFHATNAEEKKEIIQEITKYVSLTKMDPYRMYLALMNDTEIKALCDTHGMTLGTHGVSHSDFCFLNKEELKMELQQSREKIEKITGKKCNLVAFPYGSYDEETLISCKEQGYDYLFGTEKLQNAEDRHQVIERLTVNPYISAINQMYYIARNKYE